MVRPLRRSDFCSIVLVFVVAPKGESAAGIHHPATANVFAVGIGKLEFKAGDGRHAHAGLVKPVDRVVFARNMFFEMPVFILACLDTPFLLPSFHTTRVFLDLSYI